MAVQSVFEKQGLHPVHIALGEVTLREENLAPHMLKEIENELTALGFALISDKKSRIIEQIKNLIIRIVHYSDEKIQVKHSAYIAGHLHHDYSYLSRIFSETEGITIEQYIIMQKIEKAKELLVYDELNITELAAVLDYSSVAHLSAQFKKVTGMTPTQFKNLHHKPRHPIDRLGQ